ncbi:MAG TPA: aminotransferase class III-fold pyridoxal phosphate-dependent enzyme, partial [Caldilineae bacterium]|nr:aminotransferase class III-fold pyridoxal phosphate-dependent enzyme [Caldilineae bacterium]
SGVATLGLPDSPGVPRGATQDTLVAPYNDLDAVASLFEQFPESIAAVIVEPVAGNMGVVPPADGFLSGLRDLCSQHGALLIFDEVMTGFRVHPGGAQALYGIDPDLTCLGKVIGGGLPVGAYGGKREIMQTVAPAGPMYQAGTLSGNPLAMAAGIATLEELRQPGIWEELERRTRTLCQGIGAAAEAAGISIYQTQVGTMFCTFFQEGPVTDYGTARRSDTERYARFFHAMLERGVYLAPSQFEAGFMSTAHGDEEIQATIAAAEEAMEILTRG